MADVTSDAIEARLARDFDYHAPDAVKREQHQKVRALLRDAARVVLTDLPGGREQSLAVTKLEEAMFWANAAIARA